MKVCIVCVAELPESAFRTTPSGKHYHKACRKCSWEKRRARRGWDAEYEERCIATQRRSARKQCEKAAQSRASGTRTAYWIVKDSRQSDKKKGYQNDLTEQMVSDLISTGCSYCGEDKLRMTLDRVDNCLGHVATNVVPACIRCNYMRRDIPYEAWLMIVPAMIQSLQQGFLNGWNSYDVHHRRRGLTVTTRTS